MALNSASYCLVLAMAKTVQSRYVSNSPASSVRHLLRFLLCHSNSRMLSSITSYVVMSALASRSSSSISMAFIPILSTCQSRSRNSFTLFSNAWFSKAKAVAKWSAKFIQSKALSSCSWTVVCRSTRSSNLQSSRSVI
jgi:hypothetical protein